MFHHSQHRSIQVEAATGVSPLRGCSAPARWISLAFRPSRALKHSRLQAMATKPLLVLDLALRSQYYFLVTPFAVEARDLGMYLVQHVNLRG